MSLLDEVQALAVRTGPECSVNAWMQALGESEQAEVREVMLSRFPSSVVRVVLGRHYGEMPFSKDTLQRHRRRVRDGAEGCRCHS